MNRRTLTGLTAAVLYVLTIAAANEAVRRWGPVPVGFGLLAPAGVYFAGLAFTLRDITQRTLGKWAALGAITAGTVLSLVTGSGAIAIAAALAFLTSELVDFAVYSVTEPRAGFLPAVVVSNVAGLLVDSWVFLHLAPQLVPGVPNTAFLTGQIVGKAWLTAPFAAFAVAALIRRRERPQPA